MTCRDNCRGTSDEGPALWNYCIFIYSIFFLFHPTDRRLIRLLVTLCQSTGPLRIVFLSC